MKKSLFMALFAITLLAAFTACNNSAPADAAKESKAEVAEVYSCPMHPEVQSDKPGDCPKCGMPLEIREAGDTLQEHMHADTMHE